MKFKPSPRMREADFDLTPMIDVVLLLIIFFMLSSQFARIEAKELDLPAQRGEQAPEESPTELVIDIDAAGAIFIDGQELKDAELESAVKGVVRTVDAQGATSGIADVLVRADKAADASRLNTVANTLMQLNVKSWRLATAGSLVGGPAPAGGAP